jgi:hypothetical protein
MHPIYIPTFMVRYKWHVLGFGCLRCCSPYDEGLLNGFFYALRFGIMVLNNGKLSCYMCSKAGCPASNIVISKLSIIQPLIADVWCPDMSSQISTGCELVFFNCFVIPFFLYQGL